MGREIERESLHITVPHHFRCPISLDVMKSPVILCSGVTYDRSSIQHWLQSGHDTCPATMQLLPSKLLIPNLTLRRLISLWSSSCSPLSPPLLSQSQPFLDALSALFSSELVDLMSLQSAVGVLSSAFAEDGVKEKLNEVFLDGNNRNGLVSLVTVLENGDLNSKIQSVAVLEAISLNDESKRIVCETPNLIPVLIQLTDQNESALNDAILSFLITASTNKWVKTRVAELGITGVISRILNDKKGEVKVVEKSLKLLASVAKCGEGRRGISECAEGIVERLMKVSKTATEEGVLVLWGMCCWFRCGEVQEKVVRSNGLRKVLMVMQSVGDDEYVRKMCGDLVRVLKDGGGGVGSYYETHIMPC